MRLHGSAAMRALFASLGTLFVGVGIVGFFVPMLPATPFLLLAAACYARASERFYFGLLNNRFLGPSIRDWRRHRSLPRRTKIGAIVLTLTTFAVTIVFFIDSPLARVLMSLFAAAQAIFLLRIPSR